MRISCSFVVPSLRSASARFGRGTWIAALAIAGTLLLSAPLAPAFADPVKRKLLEHQDPQYPVQAKRLGVEGSVILRIVIDPDGHVSDVRVASGNPLLIDAASDAAKQWKYTTASESSVSFVQVNFSLGSSLSQ